MRPSWTTMRTAPSATRSSSGFSSTTIKVGAEPRSGLLIPPAAPTSDAGVVVAVCNAAIRESPASSSNNSSTTVAGSPPTSSAGGRSVPHSSGTPAAMALDALQVAAGGGPGIVDGGLGEVVRPHPGFAPRHDKCRGEVGPAAGQQRRGGGVKLVSVLEAADPLGQSLTDGHRSSGMSHDIGVVFMGRPHSSGQLAVRHFRAGQVLPLTSQPSVDEDLHVIGPGVEFAGSGPVKLLFALGFDARRPRPMALRRRNCLPGAKILGACATEPLCLP